LRAFRKKKAWRFFCDKLANFYSLSPLPHSLFSLSAWYAMADDKDKDTLAKAALDSTPKVTDAVTDDKDKDTLAKAILDSAKKVTGDFEDFLRMLKSNEHDTMTGHKYFNPLLSVERTDGTKFAGNPNPDDDIVVTFESGVPGKWHYQGTMKFREFLRWKLRAKREAQFSFS
jgi:hypothetical protein